jgi:hypothetical protein
MAPASGFNTGIGVFGVPCRQRDLDALGAHGDLRHVGHRGEIPGLKNLVR